MIGLLLLLSLAPSHHWGTGEPPGVPTGRSPEGSWVTSKVGWRPTPSAAGIYAPTMTGHLAGFRLAGIEPDGDPLYQVVLQTRLSASQGIPSVNVIVSAYLENFKPDTTPILPDLLHPKRKAQNLGGFLQGKALLTDDAGQVLFIGSFLAEAFLDNSNHAVMSLDGTSTAYGGRHPGGTRLKGIFRLQRSGVLRGALTGRIMLPQTARQQVLQHRGARMKPLSQIIKVVTVRPAPMKGKATTGSSGAPLRTGYPAPAPRSPSSSSSRRLSPWTIAAGVGAVVSFLLAGVLYWTGRRRAGSEPTR